MSCFEKEKTLDPIEFSVEIPQNWPEIPGSKYPHNEYTVSLGKSLFFDKRLSVDSTISCASCHKSEYGFADNIPFSKGVEGRLGERNSATLTNVAYLSSLNRDGGVSSIDIFAAVPIEEHLEMDFNLVLASERLQKDKKLNATAQACYERDISPYVILKSIGSYLRTFISSKSRYDDFVESKDSSIFSQSELRGMRLFESKGKCVECHTPPLFTNHEFENNGIYVEYADAGRFRITNDSTDYGAFRVSTLRNIALTAPYMHDGSKWTLKEVLVHYSNHGEDHPNKSKILDQIALTDQEQNDIVAFLHTLTDSSFISNPLLLEMPIEK